MLTRNEKGQFIKGICPNPAGRPKQVQSIRDLARAHTEDAMQTIVSIVKNEKASNSDRLKRLPSTLGICFWKANTVC